MSAGSGGLVPLTRRAHESRGGGWHTFYVHPDHIVIVQPVGNGSTIALSLPTWHETVRESPAEVSRLVAEAKRATG